MDSRRRGGPALLLAILLAGCSSTTDVPLPSLTGTWNYTASVTGNNGDCTEQAVINISQANAALTGTVSSGTEDCGTPAAWPAAAITLVGTITGDVVTAQLAYNGTAFVTLTGRLVDAAHLSGTEQATTPTVAAFDHGTWGATRQ